MFWIWSFVLIVINPQLTKLKYFPWVFITKWLGEVDYSTKSVKKKLSHRYSFMCLVNSDHRQQQNQIRNSKRFDVTIHFEFESFNFTAVCRFILMDVLYIISLVESVLYYFMTIFSAVQIKGDKSPITIIGLCDRHYSHEQPQAAHGAKNFISIWKI